MTILVRDHNLFHFKHDPFLLLEFWCLRRQEFVILGLGSLRYFRRREEWNGNWDSRANEFFRYTPSDYSTQGVSYRWRRSWTDAQLPNILWLRLIHLDCQQFNHKYVLNEVYILVSPSSKFVTCNQNMKDYEIYGRIILTWNGTVS